MPALDLPRCPYRACTWQRSCRTAQHTAGRCLQKLALCYILTAVSESKHSDLGEFIRQQRERADLSMRRLAEKADISNPYLSQIERGIRKPSAEILRNLSRALEISATSLYRRAGLIDEELPPATMFEAIDADERLTAEQKKVLLDMYRALVGSNGSMSAKEQE